MSEQTKGYLMVYGYIRVSTDRQDCKNQKLGIEAKATILGLAIDKYIEDAGAGTKEPEKRTLGRMLYPFIRHRNMSSMGATSCVPYRNHRPRCLCPGNRVRPCHECHISHYLFLR